MKKKKKPANHLAKLMVMGVLQEMIERSPKPRRKKKPKAKP